MNNKTTIQFSLRIIWRIMEVSQNIRTYYMLNHRIRCMDSAYSLLITYPQDIDLSAG